MSVRVGIQNFDEGLEDEKSVANFLAEILLCLSLDVFRVVFFQFKVKVKVFEQLSVELLNHGYVFDIEQNSLLLHGLCLLSRSHAVLHSPSLVVVAQHVHNHP